MKKLLIAVPVLLLAACSSNPKLEGYKGPELMQRNEVTFATRDCINNRLRPVVQYAAQKTEFGVVMLPVYVNCEPYVGR
jgi:starvation-inducible outer membrane lipoprotein